MVPGFDQVLRCARTIVSFALRHDSPRAVIVRHAPTGRFLAGDGTWTDDAADAVVIDDPAHAATVLERLSCEPVFQLVAPAVAATAA